MTTTQTVTVEQNDRIRANAARGVDRWQAQLDAAVERGEPEQTLAYLKRTLDFWTRTANRNHVGRVIH